MIGQHSTRRRWWAALAAGAAAIVLGCAALPPESAPELPLTPAQAGERVVLQDRQGPVSAAAKERDLDKLRAEGRPALLERQLQTLAAAGEADLYRGNTARLLVDGPATFAAMKAAIEKARHRILLESYIFEDDGVAADFGALLLKKAAAGVSVALLYDSVGSLGSDEAFFDGLRAGGVAVCAFNPVNPLKRPGHWGIVQRNHRKMLAVDSDVAYTGGINISNVYSSGPGSRRGSGGSGGNSGSGGKARAASAPEAPADGDPGRGWRDTQIELRGPAVAAMAAMFRASWAEQGCKGELPPAPKPAQQAPGERLVKVVGADPRVGVNPTYTALLAAVRAAQASVHLTMAYFAPGAELIDALCAAARRGADVSLVLPGRSDVKLVLHAARSHYAQLLAAGVKIHEMQRTVMHAKTAVIDGVFSSVGSSNLDWRSIVVNNEIDVIVLGDDFGQEMEALFARDVAVSTPIDAARWERRGWAQRALQGLGRLLQPLL